MNKHLRVVILMSLDALIISLCIYLSYLLRFDFVIDPEFNASVIYSVMVQAVLTIMSLCFYKIYKRVWQYASIGDLFSILKSVSLSVVAFYLLHHIGVHHFYPLLVVPRSVYLLSFMIILLGIGGSRFAWRMVRDNYIKIQPHHRKALIVGAGGAGSKLVKDMKQTNSQYYPVAFIDDDENKKHLEVLGIPIVGDRTTIPAAVEKYGIHDIILAIPSASRESIADIISICKQTKCKIKIIPGVNDLIEGKVSINAIRDVSVEDLLGRDPVTIDLNEIAVYLNGKTVLVTGAGGSIGSELCRQIASFSPKSLLLLGHGENSIYDIELELKKNFVGLAITPLIADVQDRERINRIFETYSPEVVFHAAAHKHVPLMEGNPLEAIKNNVFGTLNVAECAHQHGASHFVMISTDKAVNPTNVMGATKRIAETIVQALSKISNTKFTAVRFGNVLGSRGSVIPVFKKQISEGGPVTVTDPNMLRYFMTIPEAVQLVIQAGALANGGEIFILDMGKPVKIADLAYDLIRLSGLEPNKDIPIVYSGIRPGEKLFEELLSNAEGAMATKHDRIYIGKPDECTFEEIVQKLDKFRKLKNDEKYDPIETKKLLEEVEPTYRRSQATANNLVVEDAYRASLEVVSAVDKNNR